MTDYLKSFADGEKILAADTNSNNQYLLGQINEKAGQVSQLVNSAVNSMQATVDGVTSELGTKANLNLANTENVDSAFINKLTMNAAFINTFMPKYSKLISIASGYKTSAPCLIHVMGQTDVQTTITIGGKTFVFSYDTGDGQSAGSAQFLVPSNTTITWSASRQAYAIPLI